VLLTDGRSDRALLPIIDWVLGELIAESGADVTRTFDWADFGRWRNPPRNLRERIERSMLDFPCDLLFIHRDAERESIEQRSNEITRALDGLRLGSTWPVRVVPVRMMEAWLLVDEAAIRKAADNPASRAELGLPRAERIEDNPNPKETLHRALLTASECTGRRRQRFSVERAVHRVAEAMEDLTILRRLSAFQAFEADTRDAFTAWLESRG